ncbi:hypothetical protein [Pseudoduganella sp. HUAS MS19]
MKLSKEMGRLLMATLALFAIGLFATLAYRGHLAALGPPTLQINRVVQLNVLPSTKCSDIAALSKVGLYVQGMDTGLSAIGCDDRRHTMSFFLRHDKSAKKLSPAADEAVWSTITGSPLETVLAGRELDYDIRWTREDNTVQSLAIAEHRASLRIFKSWAPMVVTFVVWIWLLLIYLGAKSALLRDPAPRGTPLEKRTFSLAKTQMTWWFAIIFASFVFLWLVTGETPSLSPQALMLLGISTVTSVASNGVSGARTYDCGERGKFLVELLSDENGIAIHRFQMLVMTATLGLLFLYDVVSMLIMPEFDTSLLTLMGISAGTYVALKIPAQGSTSKSTEAPAEGTSEPRSDYKPTN